MTSPASQISDTVSRVYKHFSFPVVADIALETDASGEFFYLGNDAAKIDFLMTSFGGGYAPENLEKAISLLDRLPSLGSKPEIIIFDSALGGIALNKLFCQLSSNPYFSNIPLVVDASSLEEEQIEEYRRLAFIDEIVFISREESDKFLQKTSFLRKIKISTVRQSATLALPVINDIGWAPRVILKRSFDIFFSLCAIVLLLPVLITVAVLIRFESSGPVIYVSKRAGRGYKVFNFFKFRTMILDADKNVDELSHLNEYNSGYSGAPIFFKVNNDPRITRLGMFLRKTSLDELPQLFNVLLGDMSLVGNRPLPLFEAASLTTDEWAARFLAPAGMTGLWQIKKNGKNNMSVEERISLDIAYANKYNFLYDLWIMANTPSALIQRSNS